MAVASKSYEAPIPEFSNALLFGREEESIKALTQPNVLSDPPNIC